MRSSWTWSCGQLLRSAIAFPPNSALPSLPHTARSLTLGKTLLWVQRSCPITSVSCSISCSAIGPSSVDSGSSVGSQVMDSDSLAALRDATNEFPPPPGVKFSYGTSGFRTDASLLKSTVFRTGVLAALRSLSTKKATGLMITASHNPVTDNGIKLADSSGGMLIMEWEVYANKLANASDSDSFLQVVEEIVSNEAIPLRHSNGGKVLLARDTRLSGSELLAAAKNGVEAVQGVVADERGILTTPQLHWMVRAYNMALVDTEQQYYDTLSFAFRSLLDLKPSGALTIDPVVFIDGANGVGASKLVVLQMKVKNLQMNIRNTGQDGEGILNLGVGADYVQKGKVLPQNFDSTKDEERRCVSIDGDADRLVYFYYGCKADESNPHLHLLDGDKIMALFATFIKEQLAILADVPDTTEKKNAAGPTTVVPGYGSVSVGAGQTAYANGASTKYLKEKLNLEVGLTPTGVKHLHEKASAYDIGLYFEANGHGTILLKEKFIKWLKAVTDTGSLTGEKEKAIHRLIAVSEMVNQAVGDALSGILMVESILHYKGWSIREWDSIYEDVPSRHLKVCVAARSNITTTATETEVISPIELQEAIDTQISRYKDGRCFVRPSGTEDIVRVYAEANTQESADALALSVRALVHKHAGGVGPQPSLSIL